jgi:glycosyltransferase 2 family protein
MKMRVDARTLLVVALAVGLLAWFLRNANLAGVWAELRQGDWGLLTAVLLMQVVTWLSRAIRWQYLLKPLGPVRFRSALECTLIGFAAITLLPGRVGEVVRPYLLARREHLSASAAFATVVIERLLDLLTVLVLFAGVVLTSKPPEGAADPTLYLAMQTGGTLLGLAALAGFVVLFLVASHPERLTRVMARVARVLPEKAGAALTRFVGQFAAGLVTVRQPRRLFMAWVLSFPLWLAIAIAVWWGSLAFHITMPFSGGIVMVALLLVGVSVPTPGGVGGYHEAFRIGATALYGAANDRAISAAIVMHAVSFVPITVAGLIVMMREGLDLGRMRAMVREPAREEGQP